MAATIQIRYFNGASEGTGANAETGTKWNREDTQTGVTPIPKPTAAGTNYSWYKMLALYCTAGGGSTSIANRKIRFASAPATGLTGSFKAASTYVQATSGNKPTDNGTTNDAVPATYTALSTTFQTYAAASVAAANSTRNGDFAQVVIGVANNYVGGAGSAIALPNIEFQYDES